MVPMGNAALSPHDSASKGCAVTAKSIEIFRVGTHTAMGGERIAFSEADLTVAAQAYDPAKHEAPVVIGHPKHDAPAYGWVKGLTHNGGSLNARIDQVAPAFAEAVSQGQYKKVSASFYKPDSPSNPAPGGYYLRHVGFLGAQPPAVKGLAPIELSDAGDEAVTVEFGEVTGWKVGDLFRGLRNWLIGQYGAAAADEALPEYLVTSVQEDAGSETGTETGFSEPDQPTEDSVNQPATQPATGPKTAADREAEIARREAEVKRREAAFAEQDRERRSQERAAQLDALVQSGRPLPCDKARLLAFMDSLDGQEAVQFAEGETRDPNKFLLDEVLGKLPKQVDYGERAAPDAGEVATADASVIARQAVAYQEDQRKAGVVVTTAEAVSHVSQQKGA